MTLYLDDDDVAELLQMGDAIVATEQAFRLLAEGVAVNEVRHRSRADDVVLNVLWSIAPTEGVAGVKSYAVVNRDVSHGTVLNLLLYSSSTGELLAIIKADRLGQLRTGAASAVASRVLARPDAARLTIYGTGFQAEFQLRALQASMPTLQSVSVVGRNTSRRDSFVRRMRAALGIEISAVDPEKGARNADVIVTATGSPEPVFRGDWLQAGVHINAVGSNMAGKRELDRRTLERATLIVVDDQDCASFESGDLIRNGWEVASCAELGDILVDRASGRREKDDVTIFESHGLAIQDVVCASFVYARAVASGRGLRV